MKRFAPRVCLLLALAVAAGCSSKLTRSEAKLKIDALIRVQPADEYKILTLSGQVPRYGLPMSEFSSEFIHLGREGVDPEFPDLLEDSLAKLGYITITDGGPGEIIRGSVSRHFNSTRIVHLTTKVGNVVRRTDHNETYKTGFTCYPEPIPTQCLLPDFIDNSEGYQITGIAEEGIHAKVSIQIFWKLCQLALDLKPYVRPRENKVNWNYRDSWEEFLNSHSPTGSTHATILFQKFDDGWRITDENGNSEKDLN